MKILEAVMTHTKTVGWRGLTAARGWNSRRLLPRPEDRKGTPWIARWDCDNCEFAHTPASARAPHRQYNAASMRCVLIDRSGQRRPVQRPQQMFTRWYGFSLTFPGCEVFGE